MKKQTIPILLILSLLTTSCEVQSLDVQGHRGARGLRPENMLSGFEYAMDLNVTTIELDVAVTRDRHVVVTHNPYVHIKLCLNKDGSSIRPDTLGLGPFIRDLTLAEVLTYDCGSLNPDPSRFSEPPRINIPGERMPTLIDLFDLIREKGSQVNLNIEMKIDPRYDITIPEHEFVKTVVDVVQKSGMKNRINLQSFNWRTLEIAKNIDPEIKTAGLLGENSFKSISDSVPSPWLNGINFEDAGGSALDILNEAKSFIDIFSPAWRLVVPGDSLYLNSTVQEIQNAGFPVIPWTVNQQKEMATLIDLGVDGIITDYPDSLIFLLDELGINVR
ncbi:MAG: hypothetical protein ISR82_06430 [Candidatus Marinimicrobia bacterium]|nr:hypothetical protein [Candidatus Neomarinimicrobiota bacterium]MBL7010841.1 hypothetical protein [Candidatus Neomarinimicrobiota bacterium]MBL7030111.1 hypothetical protein [Candidatus Neomarinimicrobiota bacterium]